MKIGLSALLIKNSEGLFGASSPRVTKTKHNMTVQQQRVQVGLKTATMFKSLGVTVK